jgi:ferritin
MLSNPVQDAINDQINHELYASYLYLSMSAYCETMNLPGAAKWMKLQAQEELGHAMKFFDYVVERGGKVSLRAVEQPPAEFGSLLSVFEQALQHEQKVSKLINDIYGIAVQEKDYPTQVMLQWFVEEQVEEERSAEEVVNYLKMAGDHPAGLLMIDGRLGARAGGH